MNLYYRIDSWKKFRKVKVRINDSNSKAKADSKDYGRSWYNKKMLDKIFHSLQFWDTRPELGIYEICYLFLLFLRHISFFIVALKWMNLKLHLKKSN